MSAKIIPWRPRTPEPARAGGEACAGCEALKEQVYLPALIDGQVTVHALIEGLAAAGLRLHHDPASGKFVILAQ